MMYNISGKAISTYTCGGAQCFRVIVIKCYIESWLENSFRGDEKKHNVQPPLHLYMYIVAHRQRIMVRSPYQL
jgi:hypothetical protein